MLSCNTRDELHAYTGKVPARAKYTRTNGTERDVGVLKVLDQVHRRTRLYVEIGSHWLRQD